MQLKIFAQMVIITLLVLIWLLSLTACGVEASFSNGNYIRLKGWWR